MIRCLRMVDETVFGALMQNPFFDEPPRKSLHRQDFHPAAKIVESLADADARLVAFTGALRRARAEACAGPSPAPMTGGDYWKAD